MSSSAFGSAPEALSAGVRAVFSRWTALRLTAEHQGCSRAVESLLNATVSLATDANAPDEDAYIDMFYNAFDQMQTDVEDGSPEQVASVLVSMRKAIEKGDYGPVRRALEKSGNADEIMRRSVVREAVLVPEGQEEGDGEGGPSSVGASSQPPREKEPPVVDEDGFTLVNSRRKGRS